MLTAMYSAAGRACMQRCMQLQLRSMRARARAARAP
eukprot:SAG22_NODE_9606_length_579_cov_4.931250_1_plen_35_part_01